MTLTLTLAERRDLNAWIDLYAERGDPPLLREIAARAGLRGRRPSGITGLQRKGLLNRGHSSEAVAPQRLAWITRPDGSREFYTPIEGF